MMEKNKLSKHRCGFKITKQNKKITFTGKTQNDGNFFHLSRKKNRYTLKTHRDD